MKKRNSKSWLATILATAITLCSNVIGTQPMTTTHAETTKSKTTYETTAWDYPRYFSNADGTIFRFYDLYDVEYGVGLNNASVCRELSKGIYVEVLGENEEKPFYVQKYEDMDKGDTTGTFTFNGESYQYNLVAPSKLRREHRDMIEKTIVHILPTTPQKIAYFDYSKDGRILVNDLVLLNRQLAATPMNAVTNCDWVMYDQMDKDLLFDSLDYWMSLGRTQMYVRYGEDPPPKDFERSSVTTTATTTTTTTTTTTPVTWNTGIAKDIYGNDVTWYEFYPERDDWGNMSCKLPSVSVLNGESISTSDYEMATNDEISRCLEWLDTSYRMDSTPEKWRFVMSKEPIMYSWLKVDFTNGLKEELFQVCPISDIIQFEHIYGDKVNIGDGRLVYDSDNPPTYFMWCPGWILEYRPWEDYEAESTLYEGYYYDFLIDMTDKMEYIYRAKTSGYYLSIIPKDDENYCLGSNCQYPKKVKAEE